MSGTVFTLMDAVLEQDLRPPLNGESLLFLFKVPQVSPLEHRCFYELLDVDEMARSDRFRRGQDRSAFVLSRALLRRVLGTFLGLDPASIEFHYNAHGKPALLGETDLHFNVSHSEGMAAIAFSGVPVGVDIEAVTSERVAMETASFFALGEREILSGCSEVERPDLFFRFWTLKEAYAKARGQGLSIALDASEFCLQVDTPDIGFRSEQDDASKWQFHSGLVSKYHRWALALNSRCSRSEPLVMQFIGSLETQPTCRPGRSGSHP